MSKELKYRISPEQMTYQKKKHLPLEIKYESMDAKELK